MSEFPRRGYLKTGLCRKMRVLGPVIIATFFGVIAANDRRATAIKTHHSDDDDADTNFLINLTKDPYEDSNYYDNHKYNSIQKELESRSDHWAKYVVQPEGIDEDVADAAFKKCGGVCSYLDDEEKPIEVPRNKYSSSESPNIVFVLVDDWGWNDAGWKSTYMSWTTPNIDRLASEGVILDNYYTAYVCLPARSSLLTGRYVVVPMIFTIYY